MPIKKTINKTSHANHIGRRNEKYHEIQSRTSGKLIKQTPCKFPQGEISDLK